MTDLNFNEVDDVNDIVVQGGDLSLSSDFGERETARQSIRATLGVFRGEWFLDNDSQPKFGVPYLQQVLGVKGLTKEVLNDIMTEAILKDKYVSTVEGVDSSLDAATRNLSVTFSCTLKSGLVLEEAVRVNI